jgi:hypothetical protein
MEIREEIEQIDQNLKDEGFSRDERGDMIGAFYAIKNVISPELKKNMQNGEVVLHRDGVFYDNKNDMEIAAEVIKEIGKTGKSVAQMAREATEMYEDLKGNSLVNSIAELRQKAMRAFDRSEMALTLANEKIAETNISDIEERITEVEEMVRKRFSQPQVEAIETKEEEPERRWFHPLDDRHSDNAALKLGPSILDGAVLVEGVDVEYMS